MENNTDPLQISPHVLLKRAVSCLNCATYSVVLNTIFLSYGGEVEGMRIHYTLNSMLSNVTTH